ncbi:glycosyltransferase family 2 protein [Enterococcus sp.]|uniref:glycosyltransferase family 2 protein n=1 Tax=Enterococcus sp. TaxID=35783 RepID=UPI002FC96989
MNNLISIVVPIYNSERYLKRCIESIVNQSYKYIEIILVNDGSTDDSLKICEYYSLLDNRIKLINQKNMGVSVARNRGITESTGQFIGFVDSDDYIEFNMYEKLINKIKNDVDMSVLISKTINKTKLASNNQSIITSQESLEYLFLLEFPTSLWACLYRKSAIENIRLSNDIHFFEDFEFNTKVLLNISKVSLCKSDLYNYEINSESINNQRINSKKITCLKIYENLMQNQKIYENTQLRNKAEYFRAHFFVSMLLSLSKSLNNENEKYFNIFKKYARSIFKPMIKSNYVPKTYKIVIILAAVSPSLLTKSIDLFYYKLLKS